MNGSLEFRATIERKFSFQDYIGFIKKIMKLMQKGYNEIQGLEIELRILEQTSAPPSRPRKYKFLFKFFHATIKLKKFNLFYHLNC